MSVMLEAAEGWQRRAFAAEARIEALEQALRDCADDLEHEIENRYLGYKDHPAMRSKYERDMGVVIRARAALAQTGEPK